MTTVNPPLPTFVYAGPSKSGSTWIYQALIEHPDVFMPDVDPVNFFDVKYHKGLSWYRTLYEGHTDESAIGDESPGYIKSLHAPERLAEDIPDVEVIFCLRNPIDRAFSQWWHGRSWWHYGDFDMALNHHPAFDMWTNPGFYDRHLQRWERHLSTDQLNVFFFEDFVEDNEVFVEEIYEVIGVDSTFTPSHVGEKVNEARFVEPLALTKLSMITKLVIKRTVPHGLIDQFVEPTFHSLRPHIRRAKRTFSSRSLYEEGIDPELRRQLETLYAEDVRNLQERTDRNLSHWFEHVDL